MGILSGYLGLEFFKHCYTPMGEIMDLLTLLVRKRPALRLGMHFQLLLNYLCLELYDQLYTLLHHVKTVQTDLQVKGKQKTLFIKVFRYASRVTKMSSEFPHSQSALGTALLI